MFNIFLLLDCMYTLIFYRNTTMKAAMGAMWLEMPALGARFIHVVSSSGHATGDFVDMDFTIVCCASTCEGWCSHRVNQCPQEWIRTYRMNVFLSSEWFIFKEKWQADEGLSQLSPIQVQTPCSLTSPPEAADDTDGCRLFRREAQQLSVFSLPPWFPLLEYWSLGYSLPQTVHS